MTSLTFALWMLTLALDTGGHLAFKTAAHAEGDGLQRWRAMARRPWLWVGLAAFVFEFVAWLAFLSTVPLAEGVLLSTLNMVSILIGGRLLFGERLTRLRVGGVLLIAGGVILVGLG